MIKHISVFLVICISCSRALASGWCDYAVKLPNGYELVRTNASTIAIFAPDTIDSYLAYGTHEPVPPKIIGVNVRNDIVFGEIEISPNAAFGISGPPGFFILDTKNYKVQLGLDKQTWRNSLKAMGIRKVPSLRKPSRFFRLRIYASLFFKSAAVAACIALVIVTAYAMWNKRCKRGSPSGVAEEHPA